MAPCAPNLPPKLRNALNGLITFEALETGVIVSMPVTYPSGASVNLEVRLQDKTAFVSDIGGGFNEADMYGAGRYFYNEAKRIAVELGIKFDGQDMFVARAPIDALAGVLTIVANASATAAKFAARRQAERAEADSKDELFSRLSRVYRGQDVAQDVELIGASNHKWRIAVMVADGDRRALFEPVSNHYVSIVGASAKFHDFAKLEIPPSRVAVVKSRQDLGDFFGVISSAATNVIPFSAGPKVFRDLLAA